MDIDARLPFILVADRTDAPSWRQHWLREAHFETLFKVVHDIIRAHVALAGDEGNTLMKVIWCIGVEHAIARIRTECRFALCRAPGHQVLRYGVALGQAWIERRLQADRCSGVLPTHRQRAHSPASSYRRHDQTLSFTRRADDRYLIVSCDLGAVTSTPHGGPVVGIDVGLTHFATFSTSEQIANPHFFRSDGQALAKAQRRLAKEANGTPEREQRKRIVRRIHERIMNRRKDRAHKLSRHC